VFTGTAWYYSRFRPSYPRKAIEIVRTNLFLDKNSRVLDLGTGTGPLAIRLSPYVSEVVALDPNAEMLREARRLAARGKITNIRWLAGESADLPVMVPQIGDIDATVIGRAFHWMDREQTLKDLYNLTRPGGGIALIGDQGPRDVQDVPWRAVIKETVVRWLGPERKAGTTGTYNHPHRSHEEYLKASPFRDMKIFNMPTRRIWTTDHIIGYVYSTSYVSIPVLGDNKDPFEADLRKNLTELNTAGRFTERVTTQIIMAWK
jgi:ubiquinone/menaquinone biosynthesis C-methylase UbiE